MQANLNLAVYCRVSSDEQKTGGNIHRQIEQASVEIKRLGLIASPGCRLFHRVPSQDPKEQYFIDEAYNLEELRPGTAFHELLDLCRSKQVNGIYVDSIDRIFRSRSHTLRGQIMDLLEEFDIQIHTPSGPVNNGLVMQFMSAIGAEDKKQTLRKLHIGKKIKIQNDGRPPNGRAFWGYSFDKTSNKWSIVEEEAMAVRWAAAMSAGRVIPGMPPSLKLLVQANPSGVSDKEVIEGLHLAGINLVRYFQRSNLRDAERKNPNGKLPRNWLTNIYRDGRYTGQHIYRMKPIAHVGRKDSTQEERDVITIKIPIIVEESDWDLAKTARQKRACVTPRHATQEYLLQGLVYCGECGRKMGSRARHHDYYKKAKKSVIKNIAKYYVCQGKASDIKELCNHTKCHASEVLDQQIWKRLTDYIHSDVLERTQNKVLTTVHLEQEIQEQKCEIADLDISVRAKETEKGRFLNLIGKGLISEEEWTTEKNRVEKEIKELEKIKLGIQRDIKLNQNKIKEVPDKKSVSVEIPNLRSNLHCLEFKGRKELCSLLIFKVLVGKDTSTQLLLKK